MLEFGPENSPPIFVNSPVEEADEWSSPGMSESRRKDSSASYTKTPVQQNSTDPSHTETSSNDSIDAIGPLDDNGDAGRENTPVHLPGVDQPGLKEEESGDAQGESGDMEV